MRAQNSDSDPIFVNNLYMYLPDGRHGKSVMNKIHNDLVGAKYLGSICAGLASALSVVSGVLMSIPRDLVCWGEMDPGSTPPSVVTSVAGAP